MKIKWNQKFSWKNVLVSGLCAVFCSIVLGGCESTKKEETPEDTSVAESEDSNKEQKAQEIQEVPETGFLLADVANLEFYFASGAGAWCTELYIHEDGTFEGLYHDSDMGDLGEEYPNGTIYYCDFTGEFTQVEKVDDYTYAMQIEHLEYADIEGDEEIINGIRYIYSGAYGLDNAEEILIYLPGIAFEELPEEYLRWVGYYDLENTAYYTTLPFYGIYNVTQEYGFSSHRYVENTETVTFADVEEELANIEIQAAALESTLYSNKLTQVELNQTSAELYKLWDDELNFIWVCLKEKLDEDAMAELLTEQRKWIAFKESEVEVEGAEYGIGTMRPLVENEKAAELTKRRVYELAELLQR